MSRWRWIWIVSLLLLWLFCSGTATAGPLVDRLSAFPDWQGRPLTRLAKGDLVYPDWFAGDWQVTTTLTDLVAPLAPDIVTPGFESNRQFLNQPIDFRVRFVPAQPTEMVSWVSQLMGMATPDIVADRAFNGVQLAKAYLGDRAVLTVKVDPKNPNRQITLLRDDRQLVSIVTARATETPEPTQFVTTELFQQEFLGAANLYFNEVETTTAYTYHPPIVPSPPAIELSLLEPAPDSLLSLDNPAGEPESNDLLSKVSESSPTPLITAEQVTAIYLSPQDPNYFEAIDPESLFAEPRPVALYRYHLDFVRVGDASRNAASIP